MDDREIEGVLDFLRGAERLKETLRSAHGTRGRQESTAEHSWRLALMAMVLARGLAPVDLLRVLKLCLVHDLGEALHGDIPAPQQRPGGKAEAERRDLATLAAPLPPAERAEILALWEEYEAGTTREAMLVKGLDKLETLLQHSQGLNPPGFDYGFNLGYGRDRTGADPLLARLRALLDAATRARMAEPPPLASPPA
ncbi:HD domain-containing protein [Teichococcus cervicalis]|uniref:5'-deoxynucleotidase n=1 Tax=Pseudoroseomonas cervicalis ATCC 49957 TaxID=525371 RepID=D5RJR1_9PROT|nr:HD domain-containing protein [Pseudoroseomonas cervicalis]EFH12464.1 HD domain protein [Pseudoroseomonas cervicalis ATCC 49957]